MEVNISQPPETPATVLESKVTVRRQDHMDREEKAAWKASATIVVNQIIAISSSSRCFCGLEGNLNIIMLLGIY